MSAFDADAIGTGLAVAILPLRDGQFAAGLEFELGWAWAGIALPMAARTIGQMWFYAAPRLGSWGDRLSPDLPLGVDVHLADTVPARAEWQVSYAEFDPNHRRYHYGLGLAYQFDDSSK